MNRQVEDLVRLYRNFRDADHDQKPAASAALWNRIRFFAGRVEKDQMELYAAVKYAWQETERSTSRRRNKSVSK